MALIRINWRPARSELRMFALLWFPAFCAVLGLILWSRVGRTAAIGIWCGGGALSGLGLVVPSIMRWVFVGLSVITYPIGFVVSHVVLAVVFYLVFTPVGLIARIFGYDPMRRARKSRRSSYWADHERRKDKSEYFRQF